MAPAASNTSVDGSGTTLIVPVVSRLLVFHAQAVAQGRQGNLAERPGKLPVEQLERLARLRLEAVQEFDIEIARQDQLPGHVDLVVLAACHGTGQLHHRVGRVAQIGVAAESDFDGVAGAEVALDENVAAAREAAAAAEGPEEDRAALDVAHGADDQRSVLGHVAVEGHAGAAGDGDVAAGAVRDRAEDVVDAVAEGEGRLVGQPAVEFEGCVLGGDQPEPPPLALVNGPADSNWACEAAACR